MRVLKWLVPLDDELHEVGAGEVVLVDAIDFNTAGVWTLERGDGGPVLMRLARVFGTGHPVPEGATHLGSYSWASSTPPLRWHVFEG